jgi:hypothetical protein
MVQVLAPSLTVYIILIVSGAIITKMADDALNNTVQNNSYYKPPDQSAAYYARSVGIPLIAAGISFMLMGLVMIGIGRNNMRKVRQSLQKTIV